MRPPTPEEIEQSTKPGYAGLSLADKDAVNLTIANTIKREAVQGQQDPAKATPQEMAGLVIMDAIFHGKSKTDPDTQNLTFYIEQRIENERERIALDPDSLIQARAFYRVSAEGMRREGVPPGAYINLTNAMIEIDGDQFTPQRDLPKGNPVNTPEPKR